MDFDFNTGRPYSPGGQHIFVRYDQVRGGAVFADVTRRNDGYVPLVPGLLRGQVQEAVLVQYDLSAYATNQETLEYLVECARRTE